MNENPEDSGQFKMRLDDEVEPAAIASHVDELRIEKLNHRMTLITILIPVLIVVVLVMTYMDIKKRVVQTEDTGQLTAQTLSKDLESRFSNLSLGQALIEENIARFMDQTNQSIAKVQVNIKNMDDGIKKSNKSMASRKDMNAANRKLGKELSDMAQSIASIGTRMSDLNASMASQFEEINQSLSTNTERIEPIEERLTKVEDIKIDKAAMDLALKLEILKLKQVVKVQMDDIQSQLKKLEDKMDKQAAQAAKRSTPPALSSPGTRPSPPGTLKEQTIQ